MDAKEIIKNVRKLQVKSKGLSTQIFSGDYSTTFKGKGMAFSEVREYMMGDEIRTIDWNVTARFNETHVKVFEEERELNMMLIADLSASDHFGTNQVSKRRLLTEICAVLAFSATSNSDKVGLIIVTDKVEKFIPPKKGKGHALRIVRELVDFESDRKGTSLDSGLKMLQKLIKKKSIVFLLSDFLDKDYDRSLQMVNSKHDLIALPIFDKREWELPNMGWVNFQDPETGEERVINTSDKQVRDDYKAQGELRHEELKNKLEKQGIDHIFLETGSDYILPLRQLFHKR